MTHVSYNYLEIRSKCLPSLPDQMFSNINAIFNGCRERVLRCQPVTHRDSSFSSGICVPLQDPVRPVAIVVSDSYFLVNESGELYDFSLFKIYPPPCANIKIPVIGSCFSGLNIRHGISLPFSREGSLTSLP